MFKWLNLPLQVVVEYITDMEEKIRDDTPYLADHLYDHHQHVNPHTTTDYYHTPTRGCHVAILPLIVQRLLHLI